MKFSIITPSLQRPSLVDACRSVETQSFTDWQHIVCIDGTDVDFELAGKIAHPQRQVIYTPETHNYGNQQRWFAWEYATGDVLVMLDDDNRLSNRHALKHIVAALESANNPDWAIFPIYRHGQRFFNDPPGLCMTDTMNVVVKRELGRWPDIPDYTADGIWVEALKAKHPYAAFPDVYPIGIMDVSNEGR